ncbi:WecB/TagA/CpsF family glycosyltransferase [Enterococcus sp.]|jgi:N-acetylglucosaminyldiphosphoundecaprenol N-acetyl-beta-D-mannosaminyltransferase|uniref:WecB/TagA/CpsF family glycosyltransferase n=1 Tax=Enterococcus sp. TaxID=35783 RepID=UPI0028A5D02D|nr:WecB/TagA/CpsF family glycosyltransferase [Enterococcus sp.]
MITEQIMGIPVDNLTYENILEDIPKYADKNKKMSIISINPQICVESKHFPDIVKFIDSSTHRIPDGIGIVLVSKLTGGHIAKRVAGFDLMIKLLHYANENKKSVFFYGAKPEILNDAVKNVISTYPNIEISGAVDGYTEMQEEAIVAEINMHKPDFLFVALGFPKQEQWLARNLSKLDVSIFQDVGGSFDVLSGHVKRAPQIFINLHLEWLYRSISNPKRMSRIFQLPIFLVKSLYWNVKQKSLL